MKNYSALKKPGAAIGVVLAVAAAFCLSFAFCLTASGEALFDESSDYFIGADGQSYGVPIEDDEGVIAMPDMVRVKATNGEIGYVSPDEMTSAFFEGAVEQDEIETVLASLADKKARALTNAANQRFGFEVLTYDEAYEIGNLLVQANGMLNAKDAMQGVASRRIAVALEEGVISSAKANEIATMSMDAEDNSGELLLSGGFTISEQLFASIYKEAQKDVSVEVPVYASDGSTIVGVYEVDRM